MVTITNAFQRKNGKGEKFNVLTVEGGVTMVKSQKTGNFYAHTMKTNIIASMDIDSCKAMVGEKVPGTVVKENCTPYTYITPDGKEKTLNYTYVYQEEENDDDSIKELGLAS